MLIFAKYHFFLLIDYGFIKFADCTVTLADDEKLDKKYCLSMFSGVLSARRDNGKSCTKEAQEQRDKTHRGRVHWQD